MAAPEKNLGEGGAEKLLSGPAGSVKKDGVGDMPLGILGGRAFGGVVEVNVGKTLTRLEVEIMDDIVAFGRNVGGIRGRVPSFGGSRFVRWPTTLPEL